MKKMLVILGPTATGKTDLGIELAKQLNGELVSVDSRQVYEGLDVGTGKGPSGMSNVQWKKGEGFWIIDGVRVWLYDVCSPKERYHVSQYVKDAERVIEKIEGEGKLAILVGGTGFYLRGLLEGFPTIHLGVDEKLREKLEKSGVGELQEKLRGLSPAVWEKMTESDRGNPRRLVRQIEIASSKFPISNFKFQISNENEIATSVESPLEIPPPRNDSVNDVLKIGLTAPRLVLNEKIDNRARVWFEEGIVEEVKGLMEAGVSLERFREIGLEYGLIAEYVAHGGDLDKLIERVQVQVRKYAKRQMTWFKRDMQIEWFDVTEDGWREKVEKRAIDWYNS
jgi:tRNA dimethylallyltransferase